MATRNENVFRSAIISAFTIVVALIWKDVFTAAVAALVPVDDRLMTQTIAAVISTALIIVALRVFLRTEEEAEHFIERAEHYFNHHEGGESRRRR